MKIKKQIDIEIEVIPDDRRVCHRACENKDGHYCVEFRVELSENYLSQTGYDCYMRCGACLVIMDLE